MRESWRRVPIIDMARARACFEGLFGACRSTVPVIGMVHVQALPGMRTAAKPPGEYLATAIIPLTVGPT